MYDWATIGELARFAGLVLSVPAGAVLIGLAAEPIIDYFQPKKGL